MKKTTIVLSLIFALAACNSSDKGGDTTGNPTEQPAAGGEAAAPADDAAMSPEAKQGLKLIAQNDCMGCHHVIDKITGPPYTEVAEKYRGQQGIVDTLANRVINGSVGHWGTIPMTPHPSLSIEDARLMVNYVLSLKK